MIPLWYGMILGAAMAYFGFWYGRSRNWGLLEEKKDARPAGAVKENGNATAGLVRKREETPKKYPPYVRYLASPAGGRVESLEREGKKGVRIETTESKLYAPSSGRVLSVAPRGNAFLIMTDWGSEVEVRACDSNDDLLDRFFRPRVIRGEIIRRGKLLLEYDREKLKEECDDVGVYVLPCGEETAEMIEAYEERIRAGETLYWIMPREGEENQ